MDVTFFENQPYYSKIDIQGEEPLNNSQDYHFGNIPATPSPLQPTILAHCSQLLLVHCIQLFLAHCINILHNLGNQQPTLNSRSTLKRKPNQEEIEPRTCFDTDQEPDLNMEVR